MASQKEIFSVKWNNIWSEFNKHTRFQHTLLQLRNKVNKLRKQYDNFKKLLSQSRFGWDNVNKTIVVDNPSVWDSHIKWAKFKKNGFPQYVDLCIVFDGIYATGNHATRNVEYLIVSMECDNGGGNVDGKPKDFSEHHINDGVFTPDYTSTLIHEKHKLNRTPNIKRRRGNAFFGLGDTCKTLRELIKAKTSQSISDSATSQAIPPPVDPFFVSAVIDILVSMHELEQDLYNKTVERACINVAWREAERRYGLLQCLQ
ncbi:hypothetical protein BT93_B0706 [Corymbia citriodora subsp. variegata]|nr:hypothetical protein BT93_B0706 [Corymbia citriodora subsp. variegata]